MNSFFAATGCVLAFACAAIPAAALTTFDAVESQTIYFQGFSDSFAGQATPVPGLLTELTLSLTGGLGTNTLTFDYSLLNTSAAPMTSARVTFFGFDVAGADGATPRGFNFGASEAAGATGIFNAIDSGNIPMGYSDVDICFGTGSGNNCSGGGGDPGAEMGSLAQTGSFSLIFSGVVNSVGLSDPYVRYQSLALGPNASGITFRGASGVGREYTPDTPPIIPEPATWAMMIAGFGLVGAAMRRRRGVAPVTA